jgi:hypothetical protein
MLRFRVFLLAAAAAPLLSLSATAVTAQESFVFENVRTKSSDGAVEFSAPRIEVEGANVTRTELERIAGASATEAERFDLLMTLRARRIAIPEMTLQNLEDQKSRVVVRGSVAENVDAGRFDRLALGGFDGVFAGEGMGDGALKSGPIVLEGGDFSKLLAAAKAGAIENGAAKLRLFSWTGFEAAVPDPELPPTAVGGNMYRIAIGSVRAATDYAGDLPTKATASFDGMVFTAPPGSEAGRSLAGFGYQKLELGMAFDGVYDPAARTFQLNDYSLRGANAGALAVSGAFGGVGPDAFIGDGDKRVSALMGSNVTALTLRYVDSGLAQKAMAFYAATQGKNLAAVRRELTMMTGALPILMGGDPASLRLAQAFASFILDPKSLTVSLKGKKGPITWADIANMGDPSTFFSRVELTASANQ